MQAMCWRWWSEIRSTDIYQSSGFSGESVAKQMKARLTAEKNTSSKGELRDVATTSHIQIHPLYTSRDLAGWDYDRELGYPGEYPFTRGVRATMYRGQLWTMRQYAGMGDAEESNKRYKYLLDAGTTGL